MKRPNTLSARWSKAREYGVSRLNGQQGDILYEWGDGCKKADASLLHHVIGCDRQRPNWSRKPGELWWTFDPSFVQELHERGYDLTTLKFSIRKRRDEAQSGGSPEAVQPSND